MAIAVQLQRHSPLATAISHAVIQLQESRARAHDCKGYDCATCSLHLGEIAQIVEHHLRQGAPAARITELQTTTVRTIEKQICDRVPIGVGPTAARVVCIVFKREDDGTTQPLLGHVAEVAAQNLIELGAGIAIRKARQVVTEKIVVSELHESAAVTHTVEVLKGLILSDLDQLAAEVR